MRSLPSVLSLYRNEFTKFKNTKARMLDSIYHMTFRILLNLISGVNIRSNFANTCYVRNVIMGVITFPVNLFHSQTRRHNYYDLN